MVCLNICKSMAIDNQGIDVQDSGLEGGVSKT